jgi:sugar phosphate isomerase/epimerase
MKLAVSNLAWQMGEEAAAAKLLSDLGVRYIELAPTRQWPDLSQAPSREIAETRQFWADHGFEVVALQAILFGQPDLKVFADDATRARTLDYLDHTYHLAAGLGAKVLVFGSPKNRLRGELSPERAMDAAATFFAEAGRRAAAAGVVLCIEPNAPQYGCDFVTTAAEGQALVDRVNSPGFALHLDTGCMTMAGDPAENASKYPPRHFHISAPNLGPVVEGAAAYDDFARQLRQAHYQNFVSIEMKPEATGNLERVEQAVKLSQSVFRD